MTFETPPSRPPTPLAALRVTVVEESRSPSPFGRMIAEVSGVLTAESLADVRRLVRAEIEAERALSLSPAEAFSVAARDYFTAVDNVIPVLEAELGLMREQRASIALILAHPPFSKDGPHGNVSPFRKPTGPGDTGSGGAGPGTG